MWDSRREKRSGFSEVWPSAMERMFSFARRLNREPNFHPSDFMTLNSLRGRRVPPRDRSMGEIHRAAMVGNVWRMRKILFFRSSSVHDMDTWSR